MCLAAENLRGGRYYIGAVKTAERMVVIAVNAEVLYKLHSVIVSFNSMLMIQHSPL